MAESEILVVADADALRDHLEVLNESGRDHRAVGVDARGEPFLIALSGCYAETEVVLYGDPWDNEVDWGTGPSCVECMAQHPHTMDSLQFPAQVLTPPAPESATEANCGCPDARYDLHVEGGCSWMDEPSATDPSACVEGEGS